MDRWREDPQPPNRNPFGGPMGPPQRAGAGPGGLVPQPPRRGRQDWGSRVVTFHEVRPFGMPASVGWQEVPSTDPYQMPKVGPVLQGPGVDQAHRLALLESLTAGPASRWLLWGYRGSRTWKRQRLGDGLELLEPGATVPVAGTLDGYRVTVGGSLARPEDNGLEWLPAWLGGELGVKGS